jgi:Sec7-like guanine-nucleotide exchange factor
VEFVKLLISDEMQEIFAIQDNIVVNREAFRKGGKVSIERNNSPAGDMIFGTDYSTGKPLENRIKFTEKNVDDLEKIILSCSKMDSEDTDITIILKEEMPAYFLGQKDLNDVITIIQDRVQKVLDERK